MSWTEAAVRRLAEAGIVKRERVDAFSTACRGLIVISTLDFLYRDRPLGGDLARQQVDDLLRGFSGPERANGLKMRIMTEWRRMVAIGCSSGALLSTAAGCGRLGPAPVAQDSTKPRVVPVTVAPSSGGRSSGPWRSSELSAAGSKSPWERNEPAGLSRFITTWAIEFKPGEPLVELDPVDAKLGVQQAESRYLGELVKLGITKRQAEEFVQKYGISEELLIGQAAERGHRQGADRRPETHRPGKGQQNLGRQRALTKRGAGTPQELEDAENEVRTADANHDEVIQTARTTIADAPSHRRSP